jgi:hypothetical protein
LAEYAAQTHALHLVIKLGIKGVLVHGQAALSPQVVPRVFIAGGDELVFQP